MKALLEFVFNLCPSILKDVTPCPYLFFCNCELFLVLHSKGGHQLDRFVKSRKINNLIKNFLDQTLIEQ